MFVELVFRAPNAHPSRACAFANKRAGQTSEKLYQKKKQLPVLDTHLRTQMAAYLNRTISLVTGNGSSTSLNGTAAASPYDANALTDRQLHNAATDNSPLQIFVKAKKRINDIFGEIEEYVLETDRFIDGE